MCRYVRPILLVLLIAASGKLIAMWVQSYTVAEQWPGHISSNWNYLLASKQGALSLLLVRPHGAPSWWGQQYRRVRVDDELSFPGGDRQRDRSSLGFGWIRDPHYSVMRSTQTMPDGTQMMFFGAASATLRGAGPVVPYWFLVLLTAALAGIVYMRWPPRFSLRGMLIAVTVIAVVLALEATLGR